jgi:hypothetical protein
LTDWPPGDDSPHVEAEATRRLLDRESPFTSRLLDSPTVNLTPRELLELVAKALGDYPEAKRERELRRQAEAQCERFRKAMMDAERRAEKMVHLIEADNADREMTEEMLRRELGEQNTAGDVHELVGALAETVAALEEAESGWDSFQIKKLLRRWQDRIRQEGRPT